MFKSRAKNNVEDTNIRISKVQASLSQVGLAKKVKSRMRIELTMFHSGQTEVKLSDMNLETVLIR